MTYQVLARKWRPKTFAEMVGQRHVLQALENALDHGRLHHAYLFTGTRGVGKTTVARILAKCLNCEQGISAKPCGTCSACVGIDEGRFIDLIEVDAASRAKVDETRDLMDQVQYAPNIGRYKIYLIDEVHMFSGHSFNALLKTLEEPPPHIKFLLATTELKKIPVTILSRCLQFNLKHLSATQIEKQLSKILESEGVESDPGSRRLLAAAADGSLRDALSLLDQAIAYGAGSLDETQVSTMLGAVDSQDLYGLLEAILDEDAGNLFQHADQIAVHNPDYDAVIVALLSMLQKIALAQLLHIEEPEQDEKIQALATRVSKEDIQLYYQIGLMGRKDLPVAPDPRRGFEMILLRMLAFKPASQVKRASAPVERQPQAAERIDSGIADSGPLDFSAQTDWQSALDKMSLTGRLKELAEHCALEEYADNSVHLVLAPEKEFLLGKDETRQRHVHRLNQALAEKFGTDLSLKISVQAPSKETPAGKKAREGAIKQSLAESSFKADENVRAIQEIFGARLDEESIKPL